MVKGVAGHGETQQGGSSECVCKALGGRDVQLGRVATVEDGPTGSDGWQEKCQLFSQRPNTNVANTQRVHIYKMKLL